MQPSNPDSLYLLRLYWDHSLVMRGVIFGVAGYGIWTLLIVIVEAARETFKRPIPRSISHQLVACWAATFFIVAGVLLASKMLEPLPMR